MILCLPKIRQMYPLSFHPAKEEITIALSKASLPTKKRILRVCVRLFLEKGYTKTKVADIVQLAGVSNSSFQNIFRAKDGILTDLVQFMFTNQFSTARSTTGAHLPPIYVYAVETATQITLTELNENLREIYLEAYNHEEALSFIQHSTARELYEIFGVYQPELSEEDFFNLDIGSSGIMRGYMAHRCDENMPLKKKIACFLRMTFGAYHVPEAQLEQVLSFMDSLDIQQIAQQVMVHLFESLAMHYDFSLDGILPPAKA